MSCLWEGLKSVDEGDGSRDYGRERGVLAILDEDERKYHVDLPEEPCKLMWA